MRNSLKIIFAGTPEFAALHLEALLGADFNICAVITQEDKPAGRGRKLTSSPVKKVAEKHNISIYQPKTLKDQEIQEIINKLNPDIIVDVACGLLVPKIILDMPKYGCINVHPSLLPRWRGATPIQRAILNGDKETGISIMQMDEGYDTGPVLLQKKCLIEESDTTKTLHDRLVKLGIKTLIEAIEKLLTSSLHAVKQDESGSCYAKKFEKTEAVIDWEKSAIELDRQVRAFNPSPVANTTINDQVIRIWKSKPLVEGVDEKPGTIVRVNKEGVDIATGKGVLRLLEMQFPGGKVLSVQDVVNSKKEFFGKSKITKICG